MIKFEFHEDLDRETIDSLWEQDIDMDDWDYVLFVPKKYESEFEKDEDSWRGQGRLGTVRPKSCQVDRLMNGSCANVWYTCKFMGKQGILGVAYHA